MDKLLDVQIKLNELLDIELLLMKSDYQAYMKLEHIFNKRKEQYFKEVDELCKK